MAQGWLIIERYENWEVDAANNFSFFGLPNRYRKIASEISEGDLVICYVSSGRSAFSDVRAVKEAGIRPLKIQSYDSAFTYYFSTTSKLVLPKEKWLPIKDIAAELDLTRGRNDYRAMLQTSIRRLSDHDAKFLEQKLRAAMSR